MTSKTMPYPLTYELQFGYYAGYEGNANTQGHRNADMREGDISCLPERQTTPVDSGEEGGLV